MRRFWSKVDIKGDNDCWPWTAATHPRSGYGRFGLDGKNRLAHRVAWFLTHGSWPKKNLMHTCDNPPCCNPAHLQEGSQSDNMEDCARKERAGNRILTTEQVRSIKRRLGTTTQQALANEYGVAHQTINNIARGIRWRHV